MNHGEVRFSIRAKRECDYYKNSKLFLYNIRVRSLIVFFFSEMLNANKTMRKRAINANKPHMNSAMEDKCLMDSLIEKYNQIAKNKYLQQRKEIDADYTIINDHLLSRAYDGLLNDIERLKRIIREEEEQDTMLYGEYDGVLEVDSPQTIEGWKYTLNNDNTLKVNLDDTNTTELPENLPYNYIKDASGNEAYPVKSINGMFNNCTNITEIDMNDWDTSLITDMSFAFAGCTGLKVLNIDKWNTYNVTTLEATFKFCEKLSALDISNWDVSNVTNLNNTFQNCSSLAMLNLDNWDVRSIASVDNIFNSCSSLETLNVRWSNMPPIEHINTAFFDCNALTNLDLTTWAFLGANNYTFADQAGGSSITSIIQNLTEITIQWGVFSYVQSKLFLAVNGVTWYEKESETLIDSSIKTWQTSWGLVATFVRATD